MVILSEAKNLSKCLSEKSPEREAGFFAFVSE
jgi:hypothetical protein